MMDFSVDILQRVFYLQTTPGVQRERVLPRSEAPLCLSDLCGARSGRADSCLSLFCGVDAFWRRVPAGHRPGQAPLLVFHILFCAARLAAWLSRSLCGRLLWRICDAHLAALCCIC